MKNRKKQEDVLWNLSLFSAAYRYVELTPPIINVHHMPNLTFLHVFQLSAYSHAHKANKTKLRKTIKTQKYNLL